MRFGQGALNGGGLAADGPTPETPESLVASAARKAAALASDSSDQPAM
jgi:hypothetical protein